MTWTVVSGPRYVEGQDAAPYVARFDWEISRGADRRQVRVFVSPDAEGLDQPGSAQESVLAASLGGRSAFEPHLDDDEPPTRFVITRDGVSVLG